MGARSREKQLILFPENLNVSREASLQVSCYIAGNFEAGNSPRCNGARRSTFAGNSALLSSDVIDCRVARSEILAGNSFIVRCHVALK